LEMGLALAQLRALGDAVQHGVKFDATITLGRHWLLDKGRELMRLVDLLPGAAAEKQRFLQNPGDWADELFHLLGATQLDALDASPYEGASVIHDLNTPLPPALAGRYDCVFDGGTLEHVFNVPQALKNAMELARVQGHVLVTTPANNALGHGFYQFSPE